jgi:hypothetical protein
MNKFSQIRESTKQAYEICGRLSCGGVKKLVSRIRRMKRPRMADTVKIKMTKVLREIASERPVYERAASAFYRVRRKAKQALRGRVKNLRSDTLSKGNAL